MSTPLLNRITKLQRQAGIDFGASTVYPLLPGTFGLGFRLGIAEFVAGSVSLDLTYDEAIYVLEGEIEIDGDGTTHKLGPGESLWMPAGRQIVYRAAAPCRFLYAIPTRSMST
jgi:ethanolamine utilization protein EutQ (cupin superfamily)